MNELLQNLSVLFDVISYQYWSVSYDRMNEAEKESYIESVVDRMNYLQDKYNLTNYTLNEVARLAEKYSYFKRSLKDVLNMDDIRFRVENINYPKTVTIA